jgi:hypothetical protein
MARNRIDTHHHPYPPIYIEKTGEVLKHTTHAFYDRLTNWKPSQAIEAMDKDGIAVSVLSMSTPSDWLGDPRRRALARECNDAAAKMQRTTGPLRPFRRAAAAGHRGSCARSNTRSTRSRPTASRLTTNYIDKYPGDDAFARCSTS